jgi:hypothetical protein
MHPGGALWNFDGVVISVCCGSSCVLPWLSVTIPFPCGVRGVDVRKKAVLDGGASGLESKIDVVMCSSLITTPF